MSGIEVKLSKRYKLKNSASTVSFDSEFAFGFVYNNIKNLEEIVSKSIERY
jgi:hypothetical protein